VWVRDRSQNVKRHRRCRSLRPNKASPMRALAIVLGRLGAVRECVVLAANRPSLMRAFMIALEM
jgi:hypothetical protein